MAGDDQALDLIGALVDLHELGITHIFFEGQVLHIAVTSEDLQQLAQEYFRGDSIAVTVLGNLDKVKLSRDLLAC